MEIKINAWIIVGLVMLFLVTGVKNIMASDIMGFVEVGLAICLASMTVLGLKEGKENE